MFQNCLSSDEGARNLTRDEQGAPARASVGTVGRKKESVMSKCGLFVNVVAWAPRAAAGTLFCLLLGCNLLPKADPPPPPPPAYEPNYKFPVTGAGKKLDVTIGVVRPQFGVDGRMYYDQYKSDDVVRGMLNAMSSSFSDILSAKGFNTKGPFESRETMTYPEKQGSDFLLYPQFDAQVSVKFTNVRQGAPQSTGKGFSFGTAQKKDDKPAAAPDPSLAVCDAVVSVIGSVAFVVQEPVTGEKMLNKRVDVGTGKQTIPGQQGAMCGAGGASSDGWTLDVKNAWAHAHENVFQASMKALNDYVNGEELQAFKAQSVELRAKKAY